MSVHAAYGGSPITIGEEVIERGWKVVTPMEFLRIPLSERCEQCDFTPDKDS